MEPGQLTLARALTNTPSGHSTSVGQVCWVGDSAGGYVPIGSLGPRSWKRDRGLSQSSGLTSFCHLTPKRRPKTASDATWFAGPPVVSRNVAQAKRLDPDPQAPVEPYEASLPPSHFACKFVAQSQCDDPFGRAGIPERLGLVGIPGGRRASFLQETVTLPSGSHLASPRPMMETLKGLKLVGHPTTNTPQQLVADPWLP